MMISAFAGFLHPVASATPTSGRLIESLASENHAIMFNLTVWLSSGHGFVCMEGLCHPVNIVAKMAVCCIPVAKQPEKFSFE
jgi:hypothetical protein